MQRSEYAAISNKNRISPDEEAYAFKAEIDEVIGAANLEETTLHSKGAGIDRK